LPSRRLIIIIITIIVLNMTISMGLSFHNEFVLSANKLWATRRWSTYKILALALGKPWQHPQ